LLTALGGLAAIVSCSECPPGVPAQPEGRELVVFAASSLKEAFASLAVEFERSNPGAKVRLHLAGSQELRIQIEQGARADLFASADGEHMARLASAKLVHSQRVFARNQPVIVVAAGNPLGIQRLGDLQKAPRLVVGAPEVPIGRYTRQILERARRRDPQAVRNIEARVVSRELNVRQVLAKVVLGEADAGIVYRTDARSAPGKLEVVPVPEALHVVAVYPLAQVTGARQPGLARQFVALVLSRAGQSRLAAAGFLSAHDGR
jgi:molybdate transport system substrate-binding protein